MFDYDWFHGPGFKQQQEEAKWRCALKHFPEVPPGEAREHAELMKFHSEVEARTLVYLRDGFSYELKDFAELASKVHLVFECVPVDEHYRVGSFLVSIPFDEIVRVEVFACHASEKPEELPQITGFRAAPEQADFPKHAEPKPHGKPGKPPKPPR